MQEVRVKFEKSYGKDMQKGKPRGIAIVAWGTAAALDQAVADGEAWITDDPKTGKQFYCWDEIETGSKTGTVKTQGTQRTTAVTKEQYEAINDKLASLNWALPKNPKIIQMMAIEDAGGPIPDVVAAKLKMAIASCSKLEQESVEVMGNMCKGKSVSHAEKDAKSAIANGVRSVREQSRILEDILMFNEGPDGKGYPYGEIINSLNTVKLVLENLFEKRQVGNTFISM